MTRLARVLPDRVVRVRDTCNVFVLRSGAEAVLVDVGSGAVFDRLDELGVERVTDVLVTHHHRDGVEGLGRAAAEGARIWVPPGERDFFTAASTRWHRRQVGNDYDLREDRFAPLEDVDVAGTASLYRTGRYGAFDVYTLPTPGHTPGSVTYIVDVDGQRLAFCGDLVYAAGKLWSLAATQWSYSGVDGLVATHASCVLLGEREPDALLPAHGEPIEEPAAALAEVRANISELVDLRLGRHWDLDDRARRPWLRISEHLLWNRAAFANSYALLSDDGAALLVDYGYDFTIVGGFSTERAARQPVLASIGQLKRDFGVERVEAAVVTHYHDDHVAGLNLLREVEGTEVWAPANVAPILRDPDRYDLPCLWFEPIAVDRVLAVGERIRWRGYPITAYPQPGHTMYAAAIAFDVDGTRALATGDQQALEASGPILNYQYRNRFRIDDFVASAKLYESVKPDLMLTGHWGPQPVGPELLPRLAQDGAKLAELHRRLLPLEEVDLQAEGFAARMEPYRSAVAPGGEAAFDVELLNPFADTRTITARLVVPDGWEACEPATVEVPAHERVHVRLSARAGGAEERARVAVEVVVGDTPFGQQAEALVDVA